MSNDSFGIDRQVEILAQEFRALSAEDRDLVVALVTRLGGATPQVYPKDVPFMDFD